MSVRKYLKFKCSAERVGIGNPFDALSVQDCVALRREMIKAEYHKMRHFLNEEEQLHLNTMEREAREIFRQFEESKLTMTQQKESLKGTLTELTDMCHKPNVELLQVRREGRSSETEILFWAMSP